VGTVWFGGLNYAVKEMVFEKVLVGGFKICRYSFRGSDGVGIDCGSTARVFHIMWKTFSSLVLNSLRIVVSLLFDC